MVVTFSWPSITRKVKLCIQIIILVIILFYVLPKLLSLIWFLHYPDPIIRDEHLLDKPMRVTATLLDMG